MIKSLKFNDFFNILSLQSSEVRERVDFYWLNESSAILLELEWVFLIESSEKSNSWSDSEETLTERESNRIYSSQLISSKSETVNDKVEKSAKISLTAFLKRSLNIEKRDTDMNISIERRCWYTSSDWRLEIYTLRRYSVSQDKRELLTDSEKMISYMKIVMLWDEMIKYSSSLDLDTEDTEYFYIFHNQIFICKQKQIKTD